MVIVCGLEQQISFYQFKQALCTTPVVLAFPNYADTFILDTAALNFAIGGELLQVQNGDSPVIIYQGVKFFFDVVWRGYLILRNHRGNSTFSQKLLR
jgi:hypothetical protein